MTNKTETRANRANQLHFSSALLLDGWHDDVVVTVGDNGIITAICTSQSQQSTGRSNDNVVALPPMVNVHSHAFQRAFAGLSEYSSADRDSFWTWRKLMYQFVDQLTPDDVFVIARQLYFEMLLAGYPWVAEFHYLHNDFDGKPFDNLLEMADAIVAAADATGIGLCLLPVLYQRAGFDNSDLSGGQRRFGLTNDQFESLVQDISQLCAEHNNRRCGIALHSLRAVDVESGQQAIAAAVAINSHCPIHIHVAEQSLEVDDCLRQTGRRPVEFLLDNFDVDDRWCLIHATHLSDSEVERIAASGAAVGLCPTTEANLGDGVYRAEEFLAAGGRIAIGSDSHCSIDLRDELRTLEYGQRLTQQRRAILGTSEHSTGRNLYCQAASGGARAIGLSYNNSKSAAQPAGIAVGQRADFTLVNARHPAIGGATGDRLLDRLIFCNAGNPVFGSVVGGVEHSLRNSNLRQHLSQSQTEFNDLCHKLMHEINS